jgi:hypothetical protein
MKKDWATINIRLCASMDATVFARRNPERSAKGL